MLPPSVSVSVSVSLALTDADTLHPKVDERSRSAADLDQAMCGGV